MVESKYISEARRICAVWGKPDKELGIVSISPDHDVVAGEKGTWTIVYTVGPRGMAAGASIRIRRHLISDWGDLQTENPEGSGYLTVECSDSNVRFDVKTWSNEVIDFNKSWPCPGAAGRHYLPWVQVTLIDGSLKQGDTITLTLGQTAYGGDGLAAQTYCETYFNFLVEADCAGGEEFQFLKVDDLFLRIVGAQAHRLVVFAPSIINRGDRFAITIKAEDKYRNVASGYSGRIHLSAQGVELPNEVKISAEDGGVYEVKCRATDCGVARIEASDEEAGLVGLSNPILIEKDPSSYLYWGEIHGHSYLSFDGRGLPENALTYARDVARLDFASLAEHHQVMSEENWKEYREANSLFNEEGKFVTFFGYEWKGGPGDQNIYYLQDFGPVVVDEPQGGESADSKKMVNKRLRELKVEGIDAIIIPHAHRCGFAKDNLLADWGYHDPEFEPAAEICSNQGIFEDWYNRGLARGYKLAPIGGTDSHHVDIGYSHTGAWFNLVGGLTAVYAESLTKNDIWRAIKERRVYGAVSTERIIADFEINGHPMGSEITVNDPTVISARVHGTGPIFKIEVIKNGQVVHCHSPEGKTPGTQQKSSIMLRIVWSCDSDFRYIRGCKTESGKLTADKGSLQLMETVHFDNHREFATQTNEQEVTWQSMTRAGDVDGVVVNVSAKADTVLNFEMPEKNVRFALPLSEILEKGVVRRKYQLRELNHVRDLASFTVELAKVESPDAWDVAFEWEYPVTGGNLDYYYLKVTQLNGHMAWTSPIWVNHDKEE